MAGSPSAPRRFPCVPAHPAPVLTQQGQEAPWAGSQLPAVLRELHLPLSPRRCSPGAPGAGPAQGNAQHWSCPPNMQNTNPKTRPDLATDAPPRGYSGRQSLQQLLSSQSRAGSWRISGRASLPSQHHSSGFFPQLMVLNTWLMKESQSLECWPCSCQFWHFSHQSTRNKSHLLPCWVTGIMKPPCARGSQPCWHCQGTVKSSAGSKTAQSQEDREYQTLGSGSSCQHLLKHQPSSTSPKQPLVVVHPLN